jgi:hypothetical protein
MNDLLRTEQMAHGPGEGDATALQLITLIDEFVEVVLEENALLARGLPASLALVGQRKNALADAFEAWVKATPALQWHLKKTSAPVRLRFMERLGEFQRVMNENVARLEAAMEASRRRIDAVMTAIRTEMIEAAPYGANGRTYQVTTRTCTRPATCI